MKREKQWYIVYTHAGNELKTLYSLHKKHIECFCPMSNSFVNGSRHKSTVMPLLPNYLFVRISFAEQAAVKQIEGVINLMYWLGKQVMVKDEDVCMLKELTEQYRVITAEKIKVNTSMAPATTWQTVSEENNSGIDTEEDFIKISFPAYGFAVMAKESKMNVRVINVKASRNQEETADMEYSR